MTAKEIAQATGREYRAVQNWVSLVSAKNAEVFAKIAQARKTSKAADYTLSEACDIIEAGLGKAAADVYRTNAANAELKEQKTKYSAAYIREIRLTLGKEAAAALLTGVIPSATKQAQITDGSERLPEHIARQVYAVAAKAWEKEQAKRESRGMQSLFDN